MRYKELAIVAGFTLLATLPFHGKAFHIDEPFFIAAAEESLRDGGAMLRSGATAADVGKAWPKINNNPPMIVSLLTPAIGLVGTSERALRLLFLPLDLLAALSLYLLFARFLKKPLLPALTVLACPAYMINVGHHLMAEKPAFAFGLAGLYALVRGVDDEDARWYWGSAPLLAAALLSKYLAAFLIPVAACYALSRGVSWKRAAVHAALAGSGLAVWIAGAGGMAVFRGVAVVSRQAGAQLWSDPAHRLRSLASFIGGCSLVGLFWPAALGRARTAGACLLAAAALFWPAWDVASVRWVDRLTGVFFSTGALMSLFFLADSRARPCRGRVLWLSWLAGSLLLIFNYWSVMARTVVFCLPALALAWAEILEKNAPPRLWERLRLAGFAVAASMGVACSVVDYRYAGAQRELAHAVAREFPPSERRVWCAAHLGLRHYLLKAGARELDWGEGGWDQVSKGDIVVLSKTNVRAPAPRRRFLADVRRPRVDFPIPLRLISGFGGEGGFFSNISGFLPYSLSAEPLEEFEVVELL